MGYTLSSCIPSYNGGNNQPKQKYGDYLNSKDSSTSQVNYILSAKGVMIPEDGGSPISMQKSNSKPTKVMTFQKVGDKFSVKNGETINFIYDGIEPEDTFVIYESTENGYNLELAYKKEPITVVFNKLCHSFIVANPNLTYLEIPPSMKYEQIIWTPREDGTWEVRIGSVERGCSSKILQGLNKLRNKQYEQNVPK